MNNPGGAASGGQWDKAQQGDMDEYIRKVAVPQVKEILSNAFPAGLCHPQASRMNGARRLLYGLRECGRRCQAGPRTGGVPEQRTVFFRQGFKIIV
jgi:hypothetical protein